MAYSPLASSYPQKHPEIEIESHPPPLQCHHRLSFANHASSPNASASTSTVADANQRSSSNYTYNIFINHRGPEVKRTFASHLYRRLLCYGLRAFLDYKEMQEGEKLSSQIKGAIATASIHVAIFSPLYAESDWCLKELLLMLQSGAPIIPVFYNVRPADLRWTKGKDGVYARALQKLQEKKTLDSETGDEKPRYDSNTIESWRNALSSVADISGFELEACNGDEGELLDKVISSLLKKVKKTSLNVAKYPTGLEEKVKDFENTVLLQQPSGKPKVVGIVGLGGIGKTTLAKELFNRKSLYYHNSCFLSDVREKAANGSLNVLQSKLIKGLTGLDVVIDSVDEGIERLIDDFSYFSEGLLILDDVDDVDQLDALLPVRVKDVIPSNCLILITSRDKGVLARSGVQDSSIYMLTGLNAQHSTELFCSHAFFQPRPCPGFEPLVDRISRACNGLPLSLRVFGALLCGNDDKTYWEYQLNKLQYILPAEIQQKLKISYDSLNKEEQQIFLDIACFFIGEKRDTAEIIWERSGWKGIWGFQNLQKKCLVDVDSENCIDMHPQLRDLGRQIAEASGLFIPSLWRDSENMKNDDLLQQSSSRQEITQVRGIRMVSSANKGDHSVGNDEFKYYASLRSDMPRSKRRIHELLRNRVMKLFNTLYPYPLMTMPNLQLLVAEDHLLERILRTVRLPNLRCLRWYKCGHSSLPSWIPMENLRVLHVVGSKLKTMWQGKSQAPLQLRELEIWAPLSKFPKSVGKLKHLEQIYISLPKKNDLILFPEEFCQLLSLKRLRLINACKMKFPKSIGKLKHLEQIYISLTEKNDLTSLPEEFCELLSLKRLELINTCKMKSLPDFIGNLANLEHLDLSFSRLERLPNSFENLIRLKYLDLRGSNFLAISTKRVPLQLPRSLQELHIKELPSNIENLSNLEVLELEDSLLEMLPPSLSALRNLKELKLVECDRLKCLSDSLGLLTKLEIEYSDGLVEVGTLPNTLIQLKLIYCPNLKKIDGLCGLENLQLLNIGGWSEVEELSGIETLVSLKELRASGCEKLKRIRGLRQLTELRLLDVSECNVLEELEGVEHLRSLEKLDASLCPNLHWDGRLLEHLPQRLKEGMLYI